MTTVSLDKKIGVPDIVFLLHASRSMDQCIQAVSQNISTFVDTLIASDSNPGVLIKDWRIRVVGYRDKLVDRSNWFIDNPFTSDIAEVKAQLFTLHIGGGGDEPESLLDAMYTLTQWSAAEKGATASPTGWRHRHDAARVVVIFTDASCHPTFKTASGTDGSVDDLIQAYHANKLKVVMYAPEAPLYADLAAMNGLEWECVGKLGEDPVTALRDYTSNTDNFRKVMEALAKTVRSELFIELEPLNSQKNL